MLRSQRPGSTPFFGCGQLGAVDEDVSWAALTLLLVAAIGVWAAWPSAAARVLQSPETTLTATSSKEQWATEGFDPQNTRFAPDASPLQGVVEWQVTVSSFPASIRGIVIADDMVYVSTAEGRLVALDARTGWRLWELTDLGPLDSSPTVAGDSIFVAQRRGVLLAANRHTGEEFWSVETGGLLYASATVVNGEVLVTTAIKKNSVQSYDAWTGQDRWSQSLDESATAPASVNGDRVVVSDRGAVYFFDLRTSLRRAKFDPGPGQTVGPPVVRNDTVYVLLKYGHVFALDLGVRGRHWWEPFRRIWVQAWVWGLGPAPPEPRGFRWDHHLDGSGTPIGLAVANDSLYVARDSGELYALDLESQRQRWKFKVSGPAQTPPSVAGTAVYFSAGHHLYAVDSASGRELWRVALDDDATSSIVVGEDVAYVGDKSGRLYAIR